MRSEQTPFNEASVLPAGLGFSLASAATAGGGVSGLSDA